MYIGMSLVQRYPLFRVGFSNQPECCSCLATLGNFLLFAGNLFCMYRPSSQGWAPECPLGSILFCPCVLYGVQVGITFLYALS